MSSPGGVAGGGLHHPPRATVFESFSTTCKCIIGSGIMSLPYAFQQSGYVVGTLFLGMVALLSYGTMSYMISAVHITRARLRRRKAASVAHAAAVAGSPVHDPEAARTEYGSTALNGANGALTERPVDPLDLSIIEADPDVDVVNYQQVAYVAFGEWGRVTTDTVLIFTQLGSCSAFLILVMTNIQACLASYDIHWSLELIALPLAPIVLMLSLPRSTTHLAPAAHFGNLTLLIGIGTIIFYGVTSPTSQLSPNAHGGEWGHILTVITDLPAYSGHAFNIMVYFGIAAFAFAAHCEVVAVEAEAKSRESYALVLPSSLAFIAVLYLFVSIFAYACFGDDTNPNILLNLGTSVFVNLVRIALSCTLLVNFALALFPASQTLDLLIAGPAPISRDLPHQHEITPTNKQGDGAAGQSESSSLLHSNGGEWPAAQIGGAPITSPDSPTPLLKEHEDAHKAYRRKGDLIRIGVVIFTFSFGLYVQDLGIMFSLVGSVAGGILCFSMPPLFWYRMMRLEQLPISCWSLTSIIAQAVTGITFVLMGIIVVIIAG